MVSSGSRACLSRTDWTRERREGERERGREGMT